MFLIHTQFSLIWVKQKKIVSLDSKVLGRRCIICCARNNPFALAENACLHNGLNLFLKSHYPLYTQVRISRFEFTLINQKESWNKEVEHFRFLLWHNTEKVKSGKYNFNIQPFLNILVCLKSYFGIYFVPLCPSSQHMILFRMINHALITV